MFWGGGWLSELEIVVFPRRATEGQGELLFVHEGPLGATKDHEERQRQLLFVHGGPLRATKDHEERQRQLLFVHGGPLRATKNTFLDQLFVAATIQAISSCNWLRAATLLEPHCWDECVRLVSDGFGGGRCGGAAPAQGRAEGPTAHNKERPTAPSRRLEDFYIGARWIVTAI